MSLNLPRLQNIFPVVVKDKLTPTIAFMQWWDQLANQIETSFSALQDTVDAVIQAQDAAAAAQQAADQAQTAADTANTAAQQAQTAATNTQAELDLLEDRVNDLENEP